MKMIGNNKIKEAVEIEYIFPGYHVVLYIIASENHIFLSLCLSIYQTIFTQTLDNKSNKILLNSVIWELLFSNNGKTQKKKCGRLESSFENIICYLAYPCVRIVNKAYNAVF